MAKIMETPNSKGRGGFWEAYQACAEENRVPPDRSPFYVNWLKTFANFIPEKPLKERTGKDIEAFLADLAKRPGIADWQVRQAQHALKILYENLRLNVTTMIYTHVLEQARPLGKKPGGYLKETKYNDVVQGIRDTLPCAPGMAEQYQKNIDPSRSLNRGLVEVLADTISGQLRDPYGLSNGIQL
jgi:hypothetical protein